MKHRIHLPPKGTGLDSDAEAPGRWDLRLKEEAFAFFAKGDIIRHDVMDECIKANEHGKLNVLSREYIFDFFRSYEAELRKATEVAFLGKVGFVLSAGDLQELLEEAAVALGVPSFMAAVSYAADNWRLVYAYPAVSSNLNASLENRNVDFTLFSFLMEGLAERDGFTRSQHGRLCAAFQRLDADESGFLEEDELPALRVWLSFCSPHEGANAAVEEAQQLTRERAEQEIMLIPKDETRLGTLQPQLQGHLSLPDFLQMMRRHFNAEYFRTQHAFRKMDGDKDSYLDLLEMRGLFQTLGLELTPRSLFEAVSFHHLGETFSHSDFLLILEYLRDTEGLCEDSWSEARGLSLKQSFDRHFVSGGFAKGDTSSGHADPFVDGTIEYSFEGSFYHFDVHSDGFISTRRAQSALEWNGFHLGMSVYSSKTDWKDRLTRSKVGEAEFLRICREQEEAETRIARTVFRKYAEKGGAGPLRREKLQLALKMVNVRYTSFFTDWLKKTTELPGQLDFEDFRDIVASFRQMNRDAYRAHSRFTQKEVNSLDDCFRKLGPDRNGKLLHGKAGQGASDIRGALCSLCLVELRAPAVAKENEFSSKKDSWWTDGWWDYDAQAAQEPDHPGLKEKLQEAQQAEQVAESLAAVIVTWAEAHRVTQELRKDGGFGAVLQQGTGKCFNCGGPHLVRHCPDRRGYGFGKGKAHAMWSKGEGKTKERTVKAYSSDLFLGGATASAAPEAVVKGLISAFLTQEKPAKIELDQSARPYFRFGEGIGIMIDFASGLAMNDKEPRPSIYPLTVDNKGSAGSNPDSSLVLYRMEYMPHQGSHGQTTKADNRVPVANICHTGFHIDEQSGSEGNDIDTGQSSPGRWEVTEDKRHAALLLPLFMGKRLLAMATLMAASMSQLLLGLHQEGYDGLWESSSAAHSWMSDAAEQQGLRSRRNNLRHGYDVYKKETWTRLQQLRRLQHPSRPVGYGCRYPVRSGVHGLLPDTRMKVEEFSLETCRRERRMLWEAVNFIVEALDEDPSLKVYFVIGHILAADGDINQCYTWNNNYNIEALIGYRAALTGGQEMTRIAFWAYYTLGSWCNHSPGSGVINMGHGDMFVYYVNTLSQMKWKR
ncbi:unnamed protein product [Symbiodinium sp. KB8]|nr:unnamed protein product [Symbiodinium sp. KB8]